MRPEVAARFQADARDARLLLGAAGDHDDRQLVIFKRGPMDFTTERAQRWADEQFAGWMVRALTCTGHYGARSEARGRYIGFRQGLLGGIDLVIDMAEDGKPSGSTRHIGPAGVLHIERLELAPAIEEEDE